FMWCLIFLVLLCCFVFFFFFQAEDGIRDSSVTGVQTCALPISLWRLVRFADGVGEPEAAALEAALEATGMLDAWVTPDGRGISEIGRASCRERGEVSVGGVAVKKKKKGRRLAQRDRLRECQNIE